jgi:hypothetical protein
MKNMDTSADPEPSKSFIRPKDWASWTEMMGESNSRVEACMAADDWPGMTDEIEKRDTLVRIALPILLQAATTEAGPVPENLKELLDEFMALNSMCVDKISRRHDEIGLHLHELKRGRRMVGMYKSARPSQPKFVDRRR